MWSSFLSRISCRSSIPVIASRYGFLEGPVHTSRRQPTTAAMCDRGSAALPPMTLLNVLKR